jgi:hypothetical protein
METYLISFQDHDDPRIWNEGVDAETEDAAIEKFYRHQKHIGNRNREDINIVAVRSLSSFAPPFGNINEL